MIPRKSIDIPTKVSGRTVTNRGVHLQPFGFHGDWLNNWQYWIDLLVSMDMSWVVIITDGDSVLQEYHQGVSPLKVLLDAGIIPIIREQKQFPYLFTEHETVRATVELYGQYGLRPFWIVRNEPFDDREWDTDWLKKRKPSREEKWDIIMEVWAGAARFIAEVGGYVGFPDGPCYRDNPFERIKAFDAQWVFDEGHAFYAGHHYGKNRPRDYPYDPVTRHGALLTEEAYRRLLDDYADERSWWEEPIELLNRRRTELKTPDLTPAQDDTCWRGWEKVALWSLETFGYVVPMALTEGGWVPRDRPGTGPNTDIRMPHSTPKMVGKKTLQMYDTPSPFFAICPWLLADEDMGGSGWPFDAWHGWAYNERYGQKKPVITALQQTPAKELKPRTEPAIIDLNADTRDLDWVEAAYGVRYQRGKTRMRLIEVHEYEGPASLDVWVVDDAGLPVEGVPFYYYHPKAPLIEGAGDEWYDRGVPKSTGADGRLSFAPLGNPRRAGDCEGAIWPKGKGDLLKKVGLLVGTSNRRLNGMWMVEKEGAPSVEEPEPEPPPPPEQTEIPAPPIVPVVPPPAEEPEEPEVPPPDPPAPPAEQPESPPPPPPPPESPPDYWELLYEKLQRIEELITKLLEQ
jgi:hypothetical protein